MANKVTPTPYFENKFKRLSKKFCSLDNDLLALENVLVADPTLGESLGQEYIKLGLQIKTNARVKVVDFVSLRI